MCHLILAVPILALPIFWLVPPSQAIPIYLGVIGVTGLLLWPAMNALRRPPVTGREGMVGARGEALTDLRPEGLIRCQGEVWSATSADPVAAGKQVRVIGVNRLRAQVVPQGR